MRFATRCMLVAAMATMWIADARGQDAMLNLMPMPAEVQRGEGSLKIERTFTVGMSGFNDARLERAEERFLKNLRKKTALVGPSKAASGTTATLQIQTEQDSKAVQEVGEDESYTLEVTASGATLKAPTTLGTLRGLQTFLQLVAVGPDGFAAPVVRIKDAPRFAWRGLMIDTARHFMPLKVLERNLDGIEAVKMNVFHWHLSENQGFRVESRKFPELQEKGSDGLYYTQEQIRGIEMYARDRGIRVVPEFDVPGHSTAWMVGHPELGSGPGPYKIERQWGIFDPALDPSNEKTYKFLDKFIEEMAKLFPDAFFHVGGDEVNGKEWDNNPKIQEFIKAHQLKGNEGLQAYFNKRLQAIVTKHGKIMIGWDEVLDPTLPKDIVIQSWRGPDSLAAAAKQGYRGILSSGWYLDLGWSAARHYAVDPMGDAAAQLSPEEKQRILGGESAIWSEYVNEQTIDSRIWPRNAAIAERLWSRHDVRDPQSMYTRMDALSAELESLGLEHRSYYHQMLQRIAGAATPEEMAALQTLTDVVEPVKDYDRGKLAAQKATSETPLNRVVDAVTPESKAGRRFRELVERYLAGTCKDEKDGERIRAQLVKWRDNDATLQVLAQRSFLVKEVAPISQDLAAVGAAGLTALDQIAKHEALNADDKARLTAALQQAATPKAELLLIPVEAVQKLAQAAATGGTCAANN